MALVYFAAFDLSSRYVSHQAALHRAWCHLITTLGCSAGNGAPAVYNTVGTIAIIMIKIITIIIITLITIELYY